MSIKLKGATSGSVELDVPAVVSGGDVSLTLPNGVGSANQLLKNGSTAGQLEYGLTLPSGNGSAGQYLRNTGTPGTLEFGDLPTFNTDLKPVFYGYDSADTTGVNGWKTIRMGTIDANQGVSSNSIYNQSNGRVTPDVAGWYVCHFCHGHINGGHSAYELRIVHSAYNNIANDDTTNNESYSNISCVTYMNGTTDYVYPQAYHNNTNHGCDNTDRRISFAVFRLPGAQS